MSATRIKVATRHQQIVLTCIAASIIATWLIFTSHHWHIAHAQAQSDSPSEPYAMISSVPETLPDTVVLPPVQLHFPLIIGQSESAVTCSQSSTNHYASVTILKKPRNPVVPPSLDPDLNLLMRGYRPVNAPLGLISIDGPTDDDAPQLAHLFRPARVPEFKAAYQIHEWDWECCPGGKLGQPITMPVVSLLKMETTPGEPIYPPRRNAFIGGAYVAMVLYASEFSMTFTYTREDTPAIGYVVHLENLCVDPNLLAVYRQMNIAGRGELLALQREDILGIAHSDGILVSVRDTGSFMDPRSGKDWWQDRVRALLAAQEGH